MTYRLPAAVALCLSLCAMAPQASAGSGSTADARFQSIYQQEWQWRIAQHLADDDALPKQRRAQLPRVDATTQEARRRYWE
ncbi:MAG: DUF885 domain-containing protein, partial [Telluria sp.]